MFVYEGYKHAHDPLTLKWISLSSHCESIRWGSWIRDMSFLYSPNRAPAKAFHMKLTVASIAWQVKNRTWVMLTVMLVRVKLSYMTPLFTTTTKNQIMTDIVCTPYIYFFFNCMFYQLLCVQHSCSSTQSWGSVLPSIVETRDQNSRGCPLLFLNRNLGSFCA